MLNNRTLVFPLQFSVEPPPAITNYKQISPEVKALVAKGASKSDIAQQ